MMLALEEYKQCLEKGDSNIKELDSDNITWASQLKSHMVRRLKVLPTIHVHLQILIT